MPGPKKKPARGGWVYVGRDDAEMLIASLCQQIEQPAARPKRSTTKRKAASRAEPSAPSAIYQLKVMLKDTHPPIWRRVQVPDAILLSRLHGVLQIVLGWTNSHLHQFIDGGLHYSIPYPDPYGEEMNIIDERTVPLNQIAPQVRGRFIYEYDFGDSWVHEITVEKLLEPEPDVEYPRCIAGKRACPPDDVGGVWGYAQFLQAIRNPKHPEHDEMLEWIGGQFDPAAFDLRGVNGMLKLYPAWLD